MVLQEKNRNNFAAKELELPEALSQLGIHKRTDPR